MHFTAGFAATAIFHLSSRRIPVLLGHAVASGVLSGAAAYLVMFRGALPLTIILKYFHLTTFNAACPKLRLAQFCIRVACVGLPIAPSEKRWSATTT